MSYKAVACKSPYSEVTFCLFIILSIGTLAGICDYSPKSPETVIVV